MIDVQTLLGFSFKTACLFTIIPMFIIHCICSAIDLYKKITRGGKRS